MDFVKRRLEDLTNHKVEVVTMLDFVKPLCASSSQSTKQRMEEFLVQWDDDSQFKSMMLVYISGSWTPVSSNSYEVTKQQPWSDFVKSWVMIGNAQSSRSVVPSSPPLHFNELLCYPLWQDMYGVFGSKVLVFVFLKCLIVLKVEQDFFVLIGSEKCILNTKLSQAVFTKPKKRSADELSGQTNQGGNPYQIVEKSGLPSQCHQRQSPPISIPPKKKRRISTPLAPVPLDYANPMLTLAGLNLNSTDGSNPSSQGIIRWFVPTSKILELLIEKRNQLKLLHNIQSSANPPISAGRVEATFVAIIKDSNFLHLSKGRLDAVLKQNCKPRSRQAAQRPEFEGLKLKEVYDFVEPVYLNVYKISETFARENGIHVNKKQRRKRKNGLENVQSNSTSVTFQSHSHSKLHAIVTEAQKESGLFPKKLSYDPLVPLGTVSALYSKSSWSRWSNSHVMVQASSIANTDEGILIVLNDIMETDVGVPNKNTESLIDILKQNDKLKDIIRNVIQLHRRVRDIHKLVKNSVTFWIMKAIEKKGCRERETKARKQYRQAHPAVKKPKILQTEVVDLTADTPSTFDPTPDILSNNSTFNTFSGKTAYIESKSPSYLEAYLEQTKMSQQEKRAFAYRRLRERIPYSSILMAIKHVFHVTRVEQILGSRKNVRGFFTFIRKSIILAGTKSTLHLGQLMASVNSLDCEWLDCLPNLSQKTRIYAKVMKWLFYTYVMTILKTSFYITEVSNSRLHAAFYLRESWKSISEHIKHRFSEAKVLVKTGSMPKQLNDGKRICNGINATVRFLPKKNHDLRPILSLKLESKKQDILRSKMVINHLVQQFSPHRIRDNNVVRMHWLKFLEEWKKTGCKKLYYVQADIQDAYPSVNVAKLNEIMLNHAKTLGNMVALDFRVISSGRIFYRQTAVQENNRKMWNSSIFTRPCIVQDTKKKFNTFNAKDIANQIAANLSKNIVRIGKNKFNFNFGLPQGWSLSEGLCNIYYGSMDSKYLSTFLDRKGEFLVTSVDDYLFLTPNPIRAARFYKTFRNGIPEFGCRVNEDKIKCNIFPNSTIRVQEEECEWVNFCGWRMCISCGHIMRDFSSYQGQDMASTLSFIHRNVTSPENFLIARMKVLLPARLHCILLDPNINCKERIVLNIYDAGFVFAFRLYAICRVIFPNLSYVSDRKISSTILNAIYGCVKALSRLILSLFRHTYSSNPIAYTYCKSRHNGLCQCVKSSGVARPSRLLPFTSTPCENAVMNRNETELEETALTEAELFFILYSAFIVKLKNHSQVFKDSVLPNLIKMKFFQKPLMKQESHVFLESLLRNEMPKHFRKVRI